MGRTSNESKDRWNAANYTQIKVSVNSQIAASFKASCKADEVSMAKVLSDFMATKGGMSAGNHAVPDMLSSRAGRRELVGELAATLELVKEAEEQYRDNIPENLKESVRHENAEHSIESIEEALSLLLEAY
jgi:hypothetical protein